MGSKHGASTRPPLPARIAALASLAAISALLVFTIACGKPERLDSRGLTKIELKLDPKDLGQMHADLFTKIKKQARVRLDGKEGAAQVRYSGQYTLLSPKKSMDLKLDKPLAFRKGRRIRLLGQPTDETALRNHIGYTIFADAGFPTPERVLASVYVNEAYQGVYLLSEALTTDFLESRGLAFVSLYQGKLGSADFTLSTPEELDTVFQPEHDNGNNTDLVRFLAALSRAKDPQAIRALRRYVDVDSILRYLAVATFLQHWDGQTNNFYLYRDATTNRFRIIPWDLDKIWQGPIDSPGESLTARNRTSGSDGGRPYSFYEENALSRKLFLIPEFKEAYRLELARLLKAWPPARIKAWLDTQGTVLEEAWAADRGYARGGRTHSHERDLLVEHVTAWQKRITPLSQPPGRAP